MAVASETGPMEKSVKKPLSKEDKAFSDAYNMLMEYYDGYTVPDGYVGCYSCED